MIWNVELVKKNLPDVRIRIDGKVCKATVRGRMLAFAQVTPETHPHMTIQYAWSTIVYALNNGTVLKA